jgi:hypothetical protein
MEAQSQFANENGNCDGCGDGGWCGVVLEMRVSVVTVVILSVGT